MKIYKHRRFQRWAKSEKLIDKLLKEAVDEMIRGLHNGHLGGGLYKKRVAMQGRGKRGGYRTLLAFKKNEIAFFLYGFAKNVQANVGEKEHAVYKELAKALLDLDEDKRHEMIKLGSLIEVK